MELFRKYRTECIGIGILWVLLFHVRLFTLPVGNFIKLIGYGGVGICLMMSGFVIYHSLWRSVQQDNGKICLKNVGRNKTMIILILVSLTMSVGQYALDIDRFMALTSRIPIYFFWGGGGGFASSNSRGDLKISQRIVFYLGTVSGLIVIYILFRNNL